MKNNIWFLAFIAVLVAIPLKTDAMSGEKLYDFCGKYNRQDAKTLVCLYYLRGVIEGRQFGYIEAVVDGSYHGFYPMETAKSIAIGPHSIGYCPPKK